MSIASFLLPPSSVVSAHRKYSKYLVFLLLFTTMSKVNQNKWAARKCSHLITVLSQTWGNLSIWQWIGVLILLFKPHLHHVFLQQENMCLHLMFLCLMAQKQTTPQIILVWKQQFSIMVTINLQTRVCRMDHVKHCQFLEMKILGVCQKYSMKCISSTSQMSKLSLILRTFSVTGLVAGLFLIECWHG